MNPILQSYLRQIDAVVEDLSETLSKQAREVKKQRKAREKLLKEYWSQERRITNFKEERARFDQLVADNERLREREAMLREKLRTVLKKAKGLAEGMRS